MRLEPPDMLCPCLGESQTDYTQKNCVPLQKQILPHGDVMTPLRMQALPGKLCLLIDRLGVDTVI